MHLATFMGIPYYSQSLFLEKVGRIGSDKKHSSFSSVHPRHGSFGMGWVKMGAWKGLMPTRVVARMLFPLNGCPSPPASVRSAYLLHVWLPGIKAGGQFLAGSNQPTTDHQNNVPATLLFKIGKKSQNRLNIIFNFT